MAIEKVGVVGCGLMGAGIAQVCASAGFGTTVSEVDEKRLQSGIDKIGAQLARAVEKGKLPEAEKKAILGRLQGTTRLADLGGCDIVIEAATENAEAKKKIFAELDSRLPKHALMASNTSSLTLIELAAVTGRPERVLGLHFFNPVPVMKLVEVVRTIVTSTEAFETARQFAVSLGKEVVEAKDTTGFVVNRLLVPYMLDAIRCYEQGLASKEDIDRGMKLGCGYPMGPFELLDFVGLDTTLYIAEIMFDEFREARFAPPSLLRRMVMAGHLGRKSGRGFYDHRS
ncbi:MAG TPA: 3-hydroxybutyryl-CoA dehydrogenase [Candidatus Krumholzibacteria bacterium]|nr:3-hydroxybutyryl-CoA dehydrogenase [Candidatus Krumholzibacteria bacterium]